MNGKTITVTAKCSDLCYVELQDANDKVIAVRDGYVPDFMPGEHYGDYINLVIDLKTGKILNWKKPSEAAIKQAFSEKR